MHPVAHPSVGETRLAKALAEVPANAVLAEVLPEEIVAGFRVRGSATTVGEALNGTYADLLWQVVTRDELVHPAFEDMWHRRTAAAAGDLRSLVELLRSGQALFLFPEGRPSPDGSVGPLRGGLGALVRRGSPASVLPIGVAYDPLTRGRTRAFVAFGEPIETGSEPEEEILDALRRATPLTCGQALAGVLLEAGSPPDRAVLGRALDTAVTSAVDEQRPVERDLLDSRRRQRRLDDCLAALSRRDPARGGADPLLRRLAREFASARERPATPAFR
jgi:hypothetical protein